MYNDFTNGELKTKAKGMFLNKRHQCKKEKISFDLDEAWIFKRLQFGCALTRRQFNINSAVTHSIDSPSIDRINPDNGYLKNNCRLILNGLNAFKGRSDDASMYDIILDLIGNRTYDVEKEIEKEEIREREQALTEAELLYELTPFFTHKQLRIIFKRFKQEPLTKTETQYYSRTIKKRLKKITRRSYLAAIQVLK